MQHSVGSRQAGSSSGQRAARSTQHAALALSTQHSALSTRRRPGCCWRCCSAWSARWAARVGAHWPGAGLRTLRARLLPRRGDLPDPPTILTARRGSGEHRAERGARAGAGPAARPTALGHPPLAILVGEFSLIALCTAIALWRGHGDCFRFSIFDFRSHPKSKIENRKSKIAVAAVALLLLVAAGAWLLGQPAAVDRAPPLNRILRAGQGGQVQDYPFYRRTAARSP